MMQVDAESLLLPRLHSPHAPPFHHQTTTTCIRTPQRYHQRRLDCVIWTWWIWSCIIVLFLSPHIQTQLSSARHCKSFSVGIWQAREAQVEGEMRAGTGLREETRELSPRFSGSCWGLSPAARNQTSTSHSFSLCNCQSTHWDEKRLQPPGNYFQFLLCGFDSGVKSGACYFAQSRGLLRMGILGLCGLIFRVREDAQQLFVKWHKRDGKYVCMMACFHDSSSGCFLRQILLLFVLLDSGGILAQLRWNSNVLSKFKVSICVATFSYLYYLLPLLFPYFILSKWRHTTKSQLSRAINTLYFNYIVSCRWSFHHYLLYADHTYTITRLQTNRLIAEFDSSLPICWLAVLQLLTSTNPSPTSEYTYPGIICLVLPTTNKVMLEFFGDRLVAACSNRCKSTLSLVHPVQAFEMKFHYFAQEDGRFVMGCSSTCCMSTPLTIKTRTIWYNIMQERLMRVLVIRCYFGPDFWLALKRDTILGWIKVRLLMVVMRNKTWMYIGIPRLRRKRIDYWW